MQFCHCKFLKFNNLNINRLKLKCNISDVVFFVKNGID